MTGTPITTLRIPRRFNGPPGSGNGGYVAGLLAAQRPDAAVTVVLRSPPPLETPMDVRDDGLYHGPTLVAEARPGAFARAVAPSVPFADADAGERNGMGPDSPFAHCFVCGGARDDGLGIHAGAVGDDLVAAPWIPDATVPIGTELIWAAMDCPGGWALAEMRERPALLGSMTAAVYQLPAVGERCVVVGRNHGDDGRKSFAATAAYGADGRLLGRAEQIWIRFT